MKHFEPSELIINNDGSAFHLHITPEQLAQKVILVGDPGRVSLLPLILHKSSAMSRVASSIPLPVPTRVSGLLF